MQTVRLLEWLKQKRQITKGWEEGNQLGSYMLQAGVQNSTCALENSLAVSHKIKRCHMTQ